MLIAARKAKHFTMLESLTMMWHVREGGGNDGPGTVDKPLKAVNAESFEYLKGMNVR